MRAHRRLTCLPIPKSAESIQRHFFFHILQMTQSLLNIGVCHFQKKPLLQCRATVNETTNISLFQRMMEYDDTGNIDVESKVLKRHGRLYQ